MASGLDQVKAYISKELLEFDNHFKDAMKSNTVLLDKITHYIVKSKGKQVRPMLVFLSSKLYGETNQTSYIAASLVELLHTATLVHDDVVDDAYKRRGFFSINALWKNKIAVLVGDYLLSKGLLLALNNQKYDLLQILSTAVKDMSEGELLQIEKARRLDIVEDIYFEIIEKKTASLISAACGVGTAAVTDNTEHVLAMQKLGTTIGISFQMKDDLFDYGKADIGKPVGIDIKEKKMTLPLIYALNKCSNSERRHIIRSIKNDSTNPQVVKEVIDFVKSYDGIAYTTLKMSEYQQTAFTMLDNMPKNEANTQLRTLVQFITERNK
jgi:octaprenyl-diphosphate synthase